MERPLAIPGRPNRNELAVHAFERARINRRKLAWSATSRCRWNPRSGRGSGGGSLGVGAGRIRAAGLQSRLQ